MKIPNKKQKPIDLDDYAYMTALPLATEIYNFAQSNLEQAFSNHNVRKIGTDHDSLDISSENTINNTNLNIPHRQQSLVSNNLTLIKHKISHMSLDKNVNNNKSNSQGLISNQNNQKAQQISSNKSNSNSKENQNQNKRRNSAILKILNKIIINPEIPNRYIRYHICGVYFCLFVAVITYFLFSFIKILHLDRFELYDYKTNSVKDRFEKEEIVSIETFLAHITLNFRITSIIIPLLVKKGRMINKQTVLSTTSIIRIR